ncbi:TetR/AcrR family transcriptional regulator [Nocardioides humilatus]|uniref:TetR/AcrR family transcriptional regulator n=1 Tax=Nocardioides humilatus TaxID=2607660 RepID=A0A5B1LM84_9ACTN|nr:TetR/AcrR family transcriptional regulator [Nocardioides humilatus]KAA1421791.1 TetR/AcrR family transcriptional regulator [Nocardioides humilatus]
MRGNQLRGRILEAAAQVLREGGPKPRLITSIAERAGVSRPTLYKYVGDRDAIYDALLRIELERVVEEIATRAEGSLSPRDDYIDVIVGLTLEARNHPALQAVLEKHPEIVASHLPRVLPIVLDIALPRLGPILEAGARVGRWPEIDPRVAITWTTRLTTAMAVMPLPEDSGEADLRREVGALLDVTQSIAARRSGTGTS